LDSESERFTLSSRSPNARVARRVLAVVVGLVLSVLAVEGGYRLLRSSDLSPTTNPAYVEHDDQLGWHYRPGSTHRHHGGEFDVEVHINAQGFRGPDWPAEKGARRPRVLILGDSFAFGWGVSFDESLPARLQALRPDWQVLGAGVSGYGTDQELLLLEQLDPSLHPDAVVVAFCENDLYECRDDVAYGKHKPQFVRAPGGLELRGVPVPNPWLERVSQAWRGILKSRWEGSFRARERDPNAEWALVFDLYRRMKSVLGPRPLVIVSDKPALARFTAFEQGMAHVDVSAAFQDAQEPVFFALDGHWNARGHARVADAVAKALGPLLP
jgi:lysophospholipase L1-like esterase